ncbi:MAG: hypothetical protein SPD91_00900, partial [Streptococcus hyointestinalis]
MSTVVGDEKLCARENDFRSLSLYIGSLSTVVGDEKLCARENDFRSLSLYVQSDENLGSKVLEVTKSKRLS